MVSDCTSACFSVKRELTGFFTKECVSIPIAIALPIMHLLVPKELWTGLQTRSGGEVVLNK